VTNAGAALPPEFLGGIRESFPSARFYAMYGQTECKRISYLDPELVDENPLSVGRAIPGTEAMVLRDDGTPAGPGEVGVLHVRGPHVMAGYWKQPELTEQTLVPGPVPGERMLRTGDLFRTDRDGLLYFVSRTDDVIMSGGNKVSPIEIETAVYSVTGVREVAAVGIPDEILGEAVVVYVATHADAELTPEEIRRACRMQLEPALVPKRVILVDELPKTQAGKISRTELRAEAIASAGA
jgi:acyl-CoA synthetase (AMP-forming)/AMP-acid ligase II